jgi:hypothetical protein
MATEDSTKIYEQVREHYSSASRITSSKYGEAVAKSFGYSADELTNTPQDANLGLSCGNPLAIASLKEGETVIDLGSGAGFDVFLAASKIGSTGRAIGIDMNDVSRPFLFRPTFHNYFGFHTDLITTTGHARPRRQNQSHPPLLQHHHFPQGQHHLGPPPPFHC